MAATHLLPLLVLALLGGTAQAYYTIPGFSLGCLVANSSRTPYAANTQIDLQFLPTVFSSSGSVVTAVANTLPLWYTNLRIYPTSTTLTVVQSRFNLSLLAVGSFNGNDNVWDTTGNAASSGISTAGIAFALNSTTLSNVQITVYADASNSVYIAGNKAACTALGVQSGAAGYPSCSDTTTNLICKAFAATTFNGQWQAPAPPRPPPAHPHGPPPPKPPKPSPRPPTPPKPSPNPKPSPSPKPPPKARKLV